MHRGGDFTVSKLVADGNGNGVVHGKGKVPSRLRRFHMVKQHEEDDDEGGGGEEAEGRGGDRGRGGGVGGRFDLSRFLEDPSPSSHDQPGSASSLRRHMVASLMQQRRAIESNRRAIQPLSPASFGSSMELTPYNPAVTPASSLDFKGRARPDPHFSLKTSTELLKVLNRIWSLEEQHASNVSMIRSLKMERDHARARIKELLRDQQADRREIDTLMKQISEDKAVHKMKEQDRLHAAVQSLRDELEDERKLRKRSEGLHRKLAREVSDTKTSLADALEEVERERKSRKLLEDLVDEFAVGIREYEHEVHSLKQKSNKEWDGNANRARLILHISESWLDERMQMKVEEASQQGGVERSSIAEKLSFEIEAFLKAKRISTLDSTNGKLARERRLSLESVPLNEAVSAPQPIFDDEGSSSGSGSNCFELKRNENGFVYQDGSHDDDEGIKEVARSLSRKKRTPRRKKKIFNVSAAPIKSEKVAVLEKEKLDVATSDPGVNDMSKVSVANDFVKGELVPGGVHLHANVDNREAFGSSSSAWRRTQASPVRQWTSRLKSTDPESEVLESSSKLLLPNSSSRENTLKSKLMEVRSKGTRSRASGRFS